jgi:hypothetical protein
MTIDGALEFLNVFYLAVGVIISDCKYNLWMIETKHKLNWLGCAWKVMRDRDIVRYLGVLFVVNVSLKTFQTSKKNWSKLIMIQCMQSQQNP